ncbi:Signal-transduction histidine kinase senX3 [compost metagenome]
MNNGQYFIFKVTDNGIGISEDDQKHLFERFFRAKNAINVQGTGLGLHIIAKYLEMMNGTIKIKSELNKGSDFTVKIPQSSYE